MSSNVVRLTKDTATAPQGPSGAPGVAVAAPGAEKPPVPLWVRSGRAVRGAVTHEHTRTAGRLAVRHSMYVVGGGKIVARRTWEGRTASRYERMLRAAEAAGNYEVAAEWCQSPRVVEIFQAANSTVGSA